ncbi:hypothetical protein ACFQ4Z_02700 [Oceanobacillus oncorhynchi subsp. oncorhynchi]|uniref:hypothetical protein n=1 Tax=Oceanobacillus oncorhynchi TaxID=545501 RepID=UPI003630C456
MDEKLIDGLVEDITSSNLEAYELVNNYLSLQKEIKDLKVYRNESSKYHVDLNEFLQKRYKEIPIKKFWGRHVVDVAMDYIKQLEEENQRYKEALEDIKINSRSDVNRAIEKACKALEGEST